MLETLLHFPWLHSNVFTSNVVCFVRVYCLECRVGSETLNLTSSLEIKVGKWPGGRVRHTLINSAMYGRNSYHEILYLFLPTCVHLLLANYATFACDGCGDQETFARGIATVNCMTEKLNSSFLLSFRLKITLSVKECQLKKSKDGFLQFYPTIETRLKENINYFLTIFIL